MSNARLALAVFTIGGLTFTLWHRKRVKVERQRAVSDERQRVARKAA